MDIHPPGFPGLVGPAGGSDFSHFDFSSHFKVLPNTNALEIASPNHDSLSLRSYLQPPQMHASPGGISPTFNSQPLRLRDDVPNGGNNGNGNGKASSPRLGSPGFHLLDRGPNRPLLGSPPHPRRRSPPPSFNDEILLIDEVKTDYPKLAVSLEENGNGESAHLEF